MGYNPKSPDEFAEDERRGQGNGNPLEQQAADHMARFSDIHGVIKNDYCPFEIDVRTVTELPTVDIGFMIACRDNQKNAIREGEIWRTMALCQRLTNENSDEIYYPGIAWGSQKTGLTKKALKAARYGAFLQIKPHHWKAKALGHVEYFSEYQPDHFKRLCELDPHLTININKTGIRHEHNRTRTPEIVKLDGVNPRISEIEIEDFNVYNPDD